MHPMTADTGVNLRPEGAFALQGDLSAMAQVLQAGLLERDTAARLMLLAAVAGEHVLLIGPPGTAKSELARRLQWVIEREGLNGQPTEKTCFERLLTRFSTPEELFGPLSLKALEDDRYERLVQGYLPTAQVAFLDEVFKANSAILNALLTLLHERVFDNGTERVPVPLVTVVGASNETPSDEALQAFHDRFLIRVPVEPVSEAAFVQLLTGEPVEAQPVAHPSAQSSDQSSVQSPSQPPERRLRAADRAAVAQVAQGVSLSEVALQALRALRTPDIRVSDRRWRQLGRLLRVAAAAEGRSTVEAADLWLVAYVAASEPAQTHALLGWWQREVLRITGGDQSQTDDAAQPDDVDGWRRSVEAFEKQLEIETHAQAEEGADAAGKMALTRSLGGVEGQGASSGMLRLYSERAETQLRKRWSPLHVRARVGQVQALHEQVQAAHRRAQQQWDHWAPELQQRLWLPPSLAHRTLQPLQDRITTLNQLVQRLQACEVSFAALPVNETLTEPAAAGPANGGSPIDVA